MAKKLKWGTIDYLNVLIDEYFATEQLPSIVGLRLHLGISDNCWRYYVSETWKIHRKSEDEIAEIEKNQLEVDANGAFEEYMEISANNVIKDEGNVEDDHVKALVSLALKRAKDRIDTFIYKTMITAKNPAGAIFYAKAALGYRETDPADSAAQMQLPAKITINIMAAPQQPVETIECKDYKVIEPLK